MTDDLTVKIVSGTSESLQVRVDLASASVLSLKQLIEQQDARRFPVSAQRLIFQGQILQDAKLLTDYHVTGGCALHLTLMPVVEATAAGPAPSDQLQSFLQQMRDHESPEACATAVQTLQKICRNIVDHPTEEKYRKLRIENATLKANLFDRMWGQESVKLLGFQDGLQTGHLVLVPTPDKWENLVACKAVVDSMATALGGAVPTAALPFRAMSSTGDFASQAQALVLNPAMLQSIASNPMVQQMIQQNPMLAQALQNPALLAQSMQALQQNPAMVQQMNQMISDPNAMRQMQQLMEGGGTGDLSGYGGTASSSAAANPFAAPSSAPLAPAPAFVGAAPSAAASSDNTNETYVEDEIAKAIARSLQDQ